jgi:hypothetical protein
MAFGLSPTDYLQIVREQHSDFKADPLSLRKAISVTILANHIGEHVFAAFGSTDGTKVDNCKDLASYRKHLEGQKSELALIRDLCDFAKHGPRLDRKSVRVAKAEAKGTMVAEYTGLLLALTNHHEEQKIVVTLDDGSQLHFDYLIEEVMMFWTSFFEARGLECSRR